MASIDNLIAGQEVWVSETGYRYDYYIRIFSHYNHEGKPYFWNNGNTAEYYSYNKSNTTHWRYVSLSDPNITEIEVWYV